MRREKKEYRTVLLRVATRVAQRERGGLHFFPLFLLIAGRRRFVGEEEGPIKVEEGIRGPRFEALAGRLSRRGGSTPPEGDLGARRKAGVRGEGHRGPRHGVGGTGKNEAPSRGPPPPPAA